MTCARVRLAVEQYALMIAYTQWICMSKPYCRCVGAPNEWDECCCTPALGESRTTRRCNTCLVPMALIDFETGEPAEIGAA